MSQLYGIYLNDTFTLARSIILKHSAIADAVNTEVKVNGLNVIEDDPKSFKYYLNLNGQYHDYDHYSLQARYGTPYIMVDIADDVGFKQVAFTKELFHGDTANKSLLNEYQLDSDFYTKLVAAYPDYETLIKGILNPIDLDTAINAPDGAILSIAHRQRTTKEGLVVYEAPSHLKGTKIEGLIEAQELNLIPKLQNWIDNSLYRWFNQKYPYIEDLYLPFTLGVLFANIPGTLLNIRLRNTHTAYAHSFHIREYLESHGKLGRYIPFIPLEQTLYLYRNVRYLENNMGKTFTFEEIIDNLFTPTGVPVSGYYAKQDISNLGKNSIEGDDSTYNFIPETRLRREYLNFKALGSGDDIRSIEETLERQIPLARENGRHLNQVAIETHRRFEQLANDDSLLVKVLESEMIETADPVPVTLFSMLVWYWAYSASNDWYQGFVFVNNPVTDERITLTPKNAFILMIYCMNYAITHQKFEFIPNDLVTAFYITKTNEELYIPKVGGYQGKIPLEEFKNQVDLAYVTEETLSEVIGDFEGYYDAYSPKDFFTIVKEHHEELKRKYMVLCSIEDLYGRGYAEHVYHHCYWHNVPIKLTEGDTPVNYQSWLTRLGISFDNFNYIDYYNLANDLITACTGIDDNHNLSRKELQKAMIGIMHHFSSYTTHWLYSVNDTDVSYFTGKLPRMSNIGVNGDASIEGGIEIGLNVIDADASGHGEVDVDWFEIDVIDAGLEHPTFTTEFVDAIPKVDVGSAHFHHQAVMSGLSVMSATLTLRPIKYDPLPSPPPPETIDTSYALVSENYKPSVYQDDMSLTLTGFRFESLPDFRAADTARHPGLVVAVRGKTKTVERHNARDNLQAVSRVVGVRGKTSKVTKYYYTEELHAQSHVIVVRGKTTKVKRINAGDDEFEVIRG